MRDLSIADNVVLKSPRMIAFLSASIFSSISACLMHFGVLCYGVSELGSVMSSRYNVLRVITKCLSLSLETFAVLKSALSDMSVASSCFSLDIICEENQLPAFNFESTLVLAADTCFSEGT